MKTDGGNFVRLQDVTKCYGRAPHGVAACEHVNLSASPGAITALVGTNGAGKSTVLKAICGVHCVSSGTVNVCGRSVPSEIRRCVGLVPETPLLEIRLTVREALDATAALYGLSSARASACIEQAVSIAELSGVYTKKIATLSKGFRQRVSLACALSHDPQVLVLDEFSAGLDPVQEQRLRKQLLRFSRSHTVIVSTHRLEELSALSSVVYVLSHGHVAAHGTVQELKVQANAESIEDAFLFLTGAERRA